MSELTTHEHAIKDAITSKLLPSQIESLIEDLVTGENEDFLQVDRVVLNPYEDCNGLFDMAYNGPMVQEQADHVERVLDACGVSKNHIDWLNAWYAHGSLWDSV